MSFHAGSRLPYKRLPCRGLFALAAGSLAALPGLALAAGGEKNALNTPVGVTDVGRSIVDLPMIILWIGVAVGALVFAVMFSSIIYHRKPRGVTVPRREAGAALRALSLESLRKRP